MGDFAYQGAVGRKIILNVYVDISSATIMRIHYRKADGTRGYFNATAESSTSISYTTVVKSDLDMLGTWTLWAYVKTPTWSDYGDPDRLLIKKPG